MNQGFREVKKQDEFDESIIQVDRVTRVSAGGKRLRFRVTVIIGNRNGKVGIGTAKATEVAEAAKKASTKARKSLIKVDIVNDTIPHRVDMHYGASKIIIKPAPRGSGIIAGGALRIMAELAGIKNISCKILGSENKLNNLRAGIKALQSFIEKPIWKTEKNNEIIQKSVKSDNKKNNLQSKKGPSNNKVLEGKKNA